MSTMQRDSTERAISQYYDSLSPAERLEEEAWGKFALAQLTETKKRGSYRDASSIHKCDSSCKAVTGCH